MRYMLLFLTIMTNAIVLYDVHNKLSPLEKLREIQTIYSILKSHAKWKKKQRKNISWMQQSIN